MGEVTGGAAVKKRFFIASLRTYDLLNVVVVRKLQHNCTSLSILDERCRFRSLNGVKCLRAADAVSTTGALRTLPTPALRIMLSRIVVAGRPTSALDRKRRQLVRLVLILLDVLIRRSRPPVERRFLALVVKTVVS